MTEFNSAHFTECLAFVLCGTVLLTYFPLGLSPIAFRPLYAAALARPATRARYELADLFVLLVHLQLSAGFLSFAAARLPVSDRVVLVLVACLSQTFWWTMSVGWITRLGLSNRRERLWFLALVAPLAFISSALGGVFLLTLPVAIFVLPTAIIFEPGSGLFATFLFGAAGAIPSAGLTISRALCKGVLDRLSASHSTPTPP